jgi:predicted HNH restriction endonuclease
LILANALGYPNVGSPNVQIGTIGKKICAYLNIFPTEIYMHSGKERPSYFTLVHDYIDNIGWQLNDNLIAAIEQLGWPSSIPIDNYGRLETEVKFFERRLFYEGKLLQVLVNRYERDPKAREACLRFHGRWCKGCGMNFKKVYGNDIPDIIHVHHTKPISSYSNKTTTDIAKDLVPLCPNCHSVVHSTKKPMNLSDLQKRINSYPVRKGD